MIKELVVASVCFCAVIACMFQAMSYSFNLSCAESAQLMKVESMYSVSTGCMIKVAGNWIPLSSYRTVKE